MRQQRVVAFEPEVPEVEVVDDLGDQLVEALHQRHTGVAVAGHPERLEHHLTELVRGGDGRGVEGRQRVAQPLPTFTTFVLAAVEQMRDHLVVAGQRWIVESDHRVDDLAPHPVAKLLRRRPPERDQQHLVQRRLALGDVPRHQAGQRERLAGARAGLKHGGRPRGGQRTQQVEVVHQRVHRSAASAATVGRAYSVESRIDEDLQPRALTPCANVRRLRIITGIAVGLPPVPRRPLRIAVGVHGLRPRERRLRRQRERLATALVVHRHQIGQQVDGGLRGPAQRVRCGVVPFLARPMHTADQSRLGS